MSNVYQLFPKKEAPVISTSKEIMVVNTKTGGVSNLVEERAHLHKTLDETLASLHTMSVSQKCDAFEGLAESMKQIFDLYIHAIKNSK